MKRLIQLLRGQVNAQGALHLDLVMTQMLFTLLDIHQQELEASQKCLKQLEHSFKELQQLIENWPNALRAIGTSTKAQAYDVKAPKVSDSGLSSDSGLGREGDQSGDC